MDLGAAGRDAAGTTQHRVSMSRKDAGRLCGRCAPEACLEGAFLFLLDREPKEAILSRFDVSVISRYFPEFEAQLPVYIDQASKRGG